MLLKELSEAVGVSGKEDAVRSVVLGAIEKHADSIRIDPMGNVTAVKKAKGKNPLRVMLAAHMDEIGFIVTGIDGDGLIRFNAIGGVDDRILPGLRVRIGDDLLPGAIIWMPIHQNRDQNVMKLSGLRIDIGASSKDEANGKVKLGDRIAFDSYYGELSSKVVRGKAFDDRVGCSLLIDVLHGGSYPVEVLAAFTVQEEIGLRGAQVAAQILKPDIAFVLEGTTANDVPNPNENPDDTDRGANPTTKMGGGPALTFMDRSMITDPRLVRFLTTTADKHKIPYQYKTQLGGGTDAGSIHTSLGGVPSAVISMPCRYIHSPVALLNLDDYQNTLKLIQSVLKEISSETLKR